MERSIVNELYGQGLRVAVVEVGRVVEGPSPAALTAELTALVQKRTVEDFPPEELRRGVRALLRRGGYHPSGRGKPASEYLAQAAREGRFPFLTALVDCNNLVSLESGLPITMLDGARFGGEVVFRFGREGERYVFNPSGQELDLGGLICTCAGEVPLGTPVKDAMAGKVTAETTSALAVIYAPQDRISAEALRGWGERLVGVLRLYAEAEAIELSVG